MFKSNINCYSLSKLKLIIIRYIKKQVKYIKYKLILIPNYTICILIFVSISIIVLNKQHFSCRFNENISFPLNLAIVVGYFDLKHYNKLLIECCLIQPWSLVNWTYMIL